MRCLGAGVFVGGPRAFRCRGGWRLPCISGWYPGSSEVLFRPGRLEGVPMTLCHGIKHTYAPGEPVIVRADGVLLRELAAACTVSKQVY